MWKVCIVAIFNGMTSAHQFASMNSFTWPVSVLIIDGIIRGMAANIQNTLSHIYTQTHIHFIRHSIKAFIYQIIVGLNQMAYGDKRGKIYVRTHNTVYYTTRQIK